MNNTHTTTAATYDVFVPSSPAAAILEGYRVFETCTLPRLGLALLSEYYSVEPELTAGTEYAFLALSEDLAGTLECIYRTDAMTADHDLSKDETVDFGRRHIWQALEEREEISNDCGTDLIADIRTFGYFQRHGKTPTSADIIKAFNGTGQYADDLAAIVTLGAYEDLAREIFDNATEITENDI